MTPPEEWPHHFIHTLEGIPENWYVDQEMHRGTTEWTTLQQNFVVTFSFEHENPNIDSTLKKIKGVIFIDEPEVELMTEYQQQNRQTVKELLSCYHVEEKHQMKMTHTIFRLQKLKEKERWKVHLWSQKYLLHLSR
jgi:hypothetical protein